MCSLLKGLLGGDTKAAAPTITPAAPVANAGKDTSAPVVVGDPSATSDQITGRVRAGAAADQRRKAAVPGLGL